jgi:hypothetical protein
MLKHIAPAIICVILCSTFSQVPEAHPSGAETGVQVSFTSKQAFALDALTAIILQAHVPIGIEFGDSENRLCGEMRAYSITNENPAEAIDKVLANTGYSIRRKDGVSLLVSPDLSGREQSLLNHIYASFPADSGSTMFGLGVQLTGWMQIEAEHAHSFAAATSRSTTSEKISIGTLTSVSTEQIANRIVLHGQKGVWMFRPLTTGPEDQIDYRVMILSYADNTNEIRQISCSR